MNDLTTKPPEPKPLQLIKNGIVAMSDQLTSVLPDHVSVERFAQVVCTAVANSNQLANVAMTPPGRQSIFIACVQCATDGLIPDGREAAIVPFKGRAAYMPMSAGLVKLMQQSGTAKDVGCELVYEKEVEEGRFHYRQTSEGVQFRHEPILFGDKGKPIGVYACIRTPDGGFYIAFCDEAEVMRAKASSSGTNTPWNGPHHLSMWKKTALKRLAKIAPTSERVLRVIDHDNREFFEEAIVEKPSMLERLQSKKGLPAPQDESEPEAPLADELPATDEPEPMTGELMEAEPKFAEALPDPCSQKQAITYAEAWSKHYKALDKAGRDAFFNETEKDVERASQSASKAQDLINDAINSPPVE